MQTEISLPNGKNRAMRICAVFNVSRQISPFMAQLVYVEFLRKLSVKTKVPNLSNVSLVAVEAVPVPIDRQ